jgi:hypothetical protein
MKPERIINHILAGGSIGFSTIFPLQAVDFLFPGGAGGGSAPGSGCGLHDLLIVLSIGE